MPLANPFMRMDISYRPEQTRPVSYDELMRFVAAADKAGEPSIGTAAMIAYFWLQRQVDILSRLAWTQYRPPDAPDSARIFHHKTGVNGGQDPRKVGGAKFFGMTFADGLAAPCRRPLGGNQRPGGKRCQRRKPPEAGAEGPR